MRRIVAVFNCRKGLTYPLTVAIALAIIIISCAAFEYMRLMIIAQGVRNAVQSAIISVAVENYNDVYAHSRGGHSAGFANDGSGFNEQLSLGDIYGRLEEHLGLRHESGQRVKYAGDVVEFRLSDLNVNVTNMPFAPSDRDNEGKFSADATIQLEVPLSFGWSHLPPLRIDLKLKAGYTAKF